MMGRGGGGGGGGGVSTFGALMVSKVVASTIESVAKVEDLTHIRTK